MREVFVLLPIHVGDARPLYVSVTALRRLAAGDIIRKDAQLVT